MATRPPWSCTQQQDLINEIIIIKLLESYNEPLQREFTSLQEVETNAKARRPVIFSLRFSMGHHTAKILYQKFETYIPEKELRSHSPSFYIHDLYIPLIGLPILLQKNRWAQTTE
jgi:hypothetical protein